MKQNLMNIYTKIDCKSYSLKDIALWFEYYDGYILKIITKNFELNIKLEKNALPHILGLHYAYANKKDSREYKGQKGFEKLKSGTITFEELKTNIRKNTKSEVAWKNIKRRIEYLPFFLNNISNKTRLRIINKEKLVRATLLRGNYALFKETFENGKKIYPLLSLKEITKNKIVIETFIVEDNLTLLALLREVVIQKIELIQPFKNDKSYIQKEKAST